MLISVVLPAYNAELYLKEAIDSVLAQTFTDFELIIINDGSKDSTEKIILSYNDERIVYVKNEQNLGLIGTLNKGISLAKGKYIARMDADDLCFPERFEKQIKFLEGNPDYVICGTSAYRFENTIDEGRAFNVPLDNESIRIRLFFNSCFIHPSVMFRTKVVKDNHLIFNEDFKYAEDYYFWIDLLKFGKGFNFKEKLLYYRVVPTSQTAVGNSNIEQRKNILGKIHKRYFSDYNIDLNNDQLELLFHLTNIDRVKALNTEKFKIPYINSFFEKLLIRLKEENFKDTSLKNELGKFYFSLFYVHRKIFFTSINHIIFSLFIIGGLSFLKVKMIK